MALENAEVATRLPAQGLDRAREFYATKLGLEPPDEILYPFDNGEFALFKSAGASSGDHTQMGFEVEDIEATVAELRARGAAPGSATARATCSVSASSCAEGAGAVP